MNFIRVPAIGASVGSPCRRQPTDHQLSALASLNRDVQTKKHARLVLRNNCFSGSETNVDALIQRIDTIKCARNNRFRMRIQARLGFVPSVNRPSGRATVRLPEHTPAERLEKVRQSAVILAAKACLRYGAAGGSSFQVCLTCDPKAVDYQVVMGANRDTYGGAFKGWSANEDHHKICVPADWRLRVQRRGLTIAGGMMTLDVHPLVPHGDIELFQAVWVGQARGYGVTIHRGVMARLGAEVYHGQDAQHSIRGVLLKSRQANASHANAVSGYGLSIEAFIERYARFGRVVVDVEDARDSGACEYGIQSWCRAVGIDMSQEHAPLRSILDGFRLQPQIEVRRAVLLAIKRHRAETRRVTAARLRRKR